MATIVMVDGSKVKVSTQQANEIWHMLNGEAEPKNEKQEAFLMKVKDVDFERKGLSGASVTRTPLNEEPDPKLQEIVKDSSLKGKDKFRAVAQRLKER